MTTTAQPATTCPTWCDAIHNASLLEGFGPCHAAHVLEVPAVVTVEQQGDASVSVWVEISAALPPEEVDKVAASLIRAAAIARGATL